MAFPGLISKNDVNRMYYKNFDEHITRKHGIVIEGWPLRTFDNPSAIGSQVELKVLLNSWQTGTTRFRIMSTEEHMAWVENCAESERAPTIMDCLAATPSLQSPPQHGDLDPTPATNPPAPQQPFNVISFESSSTTPASANPTSGTSTSGTSKRPRKVRSDRGKPRKRASQVPGTNVFHANAL